MMRRNRASLIFAFAMSIFFCPSGRDQVDFSAKGNKIWLPHRDSLPRQEKP
jgi:hypothetical protein